MRILFRVLVAITLIIVLAGRFSGGTLPAFILGPFVTWFSVSVFVFGVFGLRSAYLAWRDAPNRRAYMADVILAVAWIPYWYLNLSPRK